jgi:hypothetical protein
MRGPVGVCLARMEEERAAHDGQGGIHLVFNDVKHTMI